MEEKDKLHEEYTDEEYVERTPEEQREADKNIAYLKEVKEAFLLLENMEKDLDISLAEEKRAKKAVSSEEKSIQEEKDKIVARRRQEIENHFENQKKENREKERKIASIRSKKKNEQIQGRIKDETAGLYEEITKQKQEIKQLLKKNHVPSICSKYSYYTLFMASTVKEFLVFLVLIAAVMIGLPTIVCAVVSYSGWIAKAELLFSYALIFGLWNIILLVIYIMMMNRTKVKYYKVLLEGKQLWDKIKSNQRKIKLIERKIKKDKDESVYDLQSYDKQLDMVKEEFKAIEKERLNAIEHFEKVEKVELLKEVDNKRKEALQTIKANYENSVAKIKQCESNLEGQKERIESYVKQIGEDYVEEETLDDLIGIIEDNEANTIEEAIQVLND